MSGTICVCSSALSPENSDAAMQTHRAGPIQLCLTSEIGHMLSDISGLRVTFPGAVSLMAITGLQDTLAGQHQLLLRLHFWTKQQLIPPDKLANNHKEAAACLEPSQKLACR